MRNDPSTLTPRENEVWTLRSAGHTPRQIAERLGVAECSVKNYLTTIREKVATTSVAIFARK
jgi:DNA-binding CsgD family transcriptional regulator